MENQANSSKRLGGIAAGTVPDALKKLLQPGLDPSKQKDELRILGGGGKFEKSKQHKHLKIRGLHGSLAKRFNADGHSTDSDDAILQELLREDEKGKPCYSLQDQLLAQGTYGKTILHVILDPDTYSDSAVKELNFDRLKPLIRFLLQLQPDLPTLTDTDGETPLFAVLSSGTDPDCDEQDPKLHRSLKQRIVNYFCDDPSEENPGGLGSEAAVASLATMAKLTTDDSSRSRHAIHVAIENGISVSADVVKRLSKPPAKKPSGSSTSTKTGAEPEKKSCLEMPDSHGKTCLHIALTAPFSAINIWWAETLAKHQPGLLKATYKSGSGDKEIYVTPLQHFTEQRKKKRQGDRKGNDKVDEIRDASELKSDLNGLEDLLKRQCLAAFDNDTCKSIMYTSDNVRETYLTLEDDTISRQFLESQSQHYKLDTSLKSVHISSNIRIQWGEKSEHIQMATNKWRSNAGSIDLYMVFQWLKEEVGVKKILEVVVEDFADGERRPHSDKAIVECLKGLQVESWDWRRMDIPSDVIVDAAGEHVKTLYLYCSGLRAVLQSWSDRGGLARLKNLEKVYVEAHQGLESKDIMKEAVKKFKSDLEGTFQVVNKRRLIDVDGEVAQAKPNENLGSESAASKLKNENEQGFEEQDWLKCMDEFADFMELIDRGGATAPVKVALIDDGVKSSYAGLDENIHCGKSWAQHPKPRQGQKKKPIRDYSRNYNSSHTGHGTVMAYYIRRVCPRVQLCVAKLDPERHRQQVTFSIQSADEAIRWAVLVEKVDIISLSWAIDEEDPETKRAWSLRQAINLAADNNVLIFCANPDKGPGHTQNRTYPKVLDLERIFCIGAATQDGKSWSKIDGSDSSCDCFLPGVELGIQVESTSRKHKDDPPKEWRMHSGSSLSCALAAGLAAMILHCTLASGISASDPRYIRLKSSRGMHDAFKSINVDRSDSKWLPVRRLFGQALRYLDSTSDARRTSLRTDVVGKFFNEMRGGSAGSEQAPEQLRRRPTMKDDESTR